eukprot:GHRQ01025318.1.p1 GENE.GHRQ01025318.1~~GHRQ01025318.1.p1  ORF type:complete len:206 (-),score=31.62 GHRQ01025318.1:12-629(-)
MLLCSMRLLQNTSRGVGDLIMVYKRMTSLAGHTSRVSELLEQVRKLLCCRHCLLAASLHSLASTSATSTQRCVSCLWTLQAMVACAPPPQSACLWLPHFPASAELVHWSCICATGAHPHGMLRVELSILISAHAVGSASAPSLWVALQQHCCGQCISSNAVVSASDQMLWPVHQSQCCGQCTTPLGATTLLSAPHRPCGSSPNLH